MEQIRTALEYVRSKNLDLWLLGYVKQRLEHVVRSRPQGTRHLLVALCDHYEPLWANNGGWKSVTHAQGVARVAAWEERYPALARQYRDADGHHPRHTFFFPGEQYHEEFLDPLARLARAGLGEVEIHLHHDGDTERSLRDKLELGVDQLARHGHLSRDHHGHPRYAFIHGDWALANSRSDGRACGVDAELPLLFETGCYADFTFPAAPSECQPAIVNQIYWPTGDLRRRRSYEQGQRARVGETRDDRILIVQGPLALTVRARKMPIQLENADITASFPADAHRLRIWITQHVHVAGRPEWIFVKLHTHGAPEQTASSLLGEGGDALHRLLAARYNDGHRWQLHYVTAREMYNIAIAAMEGHTGNPGDFRDHALPPPPAALGSRPARTGVATAGRSDAIAALGQA